MRRLGLFLLLALGGLAACDLPTGDPHSGAELYAVEITERYHPAQVSVEQLFHVVNYLPRGDYRRAFWFCQAALRPDYPYAETMAVRLGACHRFNARDCGGSEVTPSDKLRAYAWYSYASFFNPAVAEKLIYPLQAHMTPQELSLARNIAGAHLVRDDRLRSLRGFLDCAYYDVIPQ